MVGHDVWLGYQSLVMPGVTIGHGAIVGGNPATPIKQRFDDEDVARLLRIAWWDWPVELVTEHARTIMAGTPGRAGSRRPLAGGMPFIGPKR